MKSDLGTCTLTFKKLDFRLPKIGASSNFQVLHLEEEDFIFTRLFDQKTLNFYKKYFLEILLAATK